MKRWQLLIALVAPIVLCIASSVCAEIIDMSIDQWRPGEGYEVTVFEDDGRWVIGTADYPEYEWDTRNSGDINGDGGTVELHGVLDPDPSITFGLFVTDFGAPSSFSFSFVLPLAPLVSNPSIVFDSLDGSVTNGFDAVGVTVTALAPPAGIPVDGDGVSELQVYTLSDDGGLTWKNVGLDAGPTTTVPLGSFGSGPYGTINQGPIATIAGGPWTHMRADINFMLSGGGDTFNFGGAKAFGPPGSIPEPGTLLLAFLSLVALCFDRRRFA